MNEPDKPPPILAEIAAEHANMPDLVNVLHRILSGRSETPTNVVQAVDTFVIHLREHFKHEDEGGFFVEIVSNAPRLSERAEAVSREHVELLAAMAAFRDAAQQGDVNATWWDNLDREFHRLMKELMHHEQRERELLQDAFLDDIGTGD